AWRLPCIGPLRSGLLAHFSCWFRAKDLPGEGEGEGAVMAEALAASVEVTASGEATAWGEAPVCPWATRGGLSAEGPAVPSVSERCPVPGTARALTGTCLTVSTTERCSSSTAAATTTPIAIRFGLATPG